MMSSDTLFSPSEPRAADIMALLGSPRRGGNTDILLTEALDSAAGQGVNWQRIVVRDLKFSPCLEINACQETGRCPIEDDLSGLYPKIAAAKVLVLATPIFFYGPSAQLKAVIDRGQAYWSRKYILKEPPPENPGRGFLISAGASQGKKLFDGLLLTVQYFFDALNFEFTGRLLVRGVDESGAVARRPEALAEARALGREMADVILGRT